MTDKGALKRMFWPIGFFLILFISPICSSGQEKPAQPAWAVLDGTWVLNSKETPGYMVTQTGKGIIWVIRSGEDSITLEMEAYISRTNSRMSSKFDRGAVLVLHPDRRGEINKLVLGNTEVSFTSKTKWSKNRLTREYRTRLDFAPGSSQLDWVEDVTEKFSISKDGKRLTFEATSRGSFPNAGEDALSVRPTKLVFDRQN